MSPHRNWDSPNPSPASECALPPPPDQRVGGAHSPADKGVGKFQFRRLEKTLRTAYSVAQNQLQMSGY